MPGRPIPFAHNSSHFVHLQNTLIHVLHDLKNVSAPAAKVLWVSCRLNRTGQTDSPVFVGWVEDLEATNVRLAKGKPYAPIEIRFADTHPSKLFSDCLAAPPGSVVSRAWGPQQADATSQKIGENYYGETHRRSISIQINNLYVGTLNAAFLGDPAAKDADIKAKLISWAQTPASQLVQYIKTSLDFSGPPHP